MTLIIDTREPNNIKNSLKAKIKNVEIDFLEVGDYLLDNGYAIERKDKDLVQSILSNRLFEQINNLCEYEHPILCITLQNLWKTFYFSKSRYIYNSYVGVISTLVTKYPRLKLVYLQDEGEFIDFIVKLDKKIHEEKESTRPAPLMRKAFTIEERKENALTAIEGISIGKAKKLLECYGSIKNIANESMEGLELAPGIGKKLAKNIWKTLN